MDQTFILQPRDPILLRDGRPFEANPGAYAKSLEWPTPGTIAGAIRTHIGTRLNFDWSKDGADRAKAIILRGALPASRHEDGTARIDVARPLDTLFYDDDAQQRQLLPLRPAKTTGGTDLPAGYLTPLEIDDDHKPAPVDSLWSLEDAARWLSLPENKTFRPAQTTRARRSETRTHVKIDPARGAAEEGELFSVEMRVFADAPVTRREKGGAETEYAQQFLLCRADCPEKYELKHDFLTLGGERRVAYIEPAESMAWPTLGDFPALRDALNGATRLRMQMATPALFKHGWRPAWVGPDGVGTPWGLAGVSLKLVGAACGRPAPVSGYSAGRIPGPKRGRYAVPAGSVYFFEVVGKSGVTPEWAEKAFLAPVSDTPSERSDGYGLALWGVW